MTPVKPPVLLELRLSPDAITGLSNRYTRSFSEQGYRCVTAFLLGSPDAGLARQLPADETIFLDLPRRALKGLRLGAAREFLALCRDIRPQVLLSHRYKPLWIMALANRRYRARGAFGVIHGLEQMQRPARRLVARTLLADPLHLIAISQAVHRDLRLACGPAKGNLHTLYNCVDLPALDAGRLPRAVARARLAEIAGIAELANGDEAAFLIGHVGRLVGSKDQATLIRAFACLAPGHPQARLVIIGEGPRRAALEQLAAQLGVHNRVHLTGAVPAASQYLGAFDLFAFTSVREGFGLALAEAMAARVPVVAVDSGGIAEVTGGLLALCPPGDAAAIGAALARMAALPPGARADLGERLRQRIADRFDYPVFHSALSELLAQTLADPATPSPPPA